MPINRLGKTRESTTCKSEIYKSYAKQYMDLMGFSPITDSFHEGHMPDVIFVNRNGADDKEYVLETKNTTLSLSDSKFAEELLNYLLNWLHLPVQKRGNLFIFAKELAKHSNSKFSFEKLFDRQYDSDVILQYVENHSKKLNDDQIKFLNSSKKEEIILFFSQVQIVEGDTETLRIFLEEKRKDNPNDIHNYAEKVHADCMRFARPLQKKSKLIFNLVPFEPPRTFYSAKIKFKDRQLVFDYYNAKNVEFPPFKLNPYDRTISTFDPITESHPFRDIIVSDVTEQEFNRDDLSSTFKIQLINEHLRRYFWKKGLRRVSDKNEYFFEPLEVDGVFIERSCCRSNGKAKIVTKPYFKDSNPNELNFIFHEASAEIKPIYLWNRFFIQIIPIKIYSNNGHAPIEGEDRDIIDRKFRNPLFNRNSHKLATLRFFEDYLFVCDSFEKEKEMWFDFFKFYPLFDVDFNWIPKTPPKNQRLLWEWDTE